MTWFLWGVLVLLSLGMAMGLARMGKSFWRRHINEGILLTIHNHRPVVAAHRGGGHPFGPENTLYSYRRSVYECRAQILEIDVRLSKDKKLVLLHDARLDRTTNGTGLVSDHVLADLKTLDARAKFSRHNTPIQPLKEGSMDDPRLFQIPSLNEVLDEFVSQKDLIFFLDMKDVGAVAPTLELIKEKKIEDRVIFGSVAPTPNREIRKLRPIGIGLPVGPDALSVLIMTILSWMRLFWIYPHKHELVGTLHTASWTSRGKRRSIKLVSERLVKDVHHSNRMFAVFGPEMNHPVEIRDCLDMGVDIIFSDRPDVARDTIEKWKKEKDLRQVWARG